MARVLSARRGGTAALAAALCLSLSACGDDDGGLGAADAPAEDATTDVVPDDDAGGIEADTDERLTVVATTSILGDIVATLIGDDGDLTVLMGPGVDPHAYQPSAADAALLREADLIVANGLGLEESLLVALDAAAQDGARVVELAEQLDPIGFDPAVPGDEREDDHGHDDDDHEHGPEDPHVWFDPIRMTDGVELLASELAAVWDGIDAEEWQARADAYNHDLLAVHDEVAAAFAAIPDERRKLVTNHDALGYLAHRYDLEVIGTVVPGSSTQAEADARAFAELIETVEATGVTAVFAENTDSAALADQLASEVLGRADLDVEVVRIYTDALGEEGSGAETYPGLLRTTARLIAGALA